ncbi:MAG: hypothetical protein RBU21_10905 [FCB group bacterium]|jgi:hypothetical protein|nr:hypothetical protein [FCB group bacterium]
MWNESERTARFISALIGLLMLGMVAGIAFSFGPVAGAWSLGVLLLLWGGLIAFGFAVNILILGALALMLKAFRFLFPIKHC